MGGGVGVVFLVSRLPMIPLYRFAERKKNNFGKNNKKSPLEFVTKL